MVEEESTTSMVLARLFKLLQLKVASSAKPGASPKAPAITLLQKRKLASLDKQAPASQQQSTVEEAPQTQQPQPPKQPRSAKTLSESAAHYQAPGNRQLGINRRQLAMLAIKKGVLIMVD